MHRLSSLLVFLLAILFVFFSICATSPPAVKTGFIPDSAFSAKRAYTHLLQIAGTPHSTGTPENVRVREYIAAECKQLGFNVEIQNATSVFNRKGIIHAANVYNVIADKKGRHHSKSVMLMAHYDSQLNTPGAGDDGGGVAAMLEAARALQKSGTLQNDLILLFTDGEEIGLAGANAFLKESPLAKGIGLVINFEGRGNTGPGSMFEVNDKNGWVINEYAKSVAHPFANSLGYEIYKKLPNYTDFTLFKNAGITGLNNAYIDGFANYHSPNDKPENLDLRSLQQNGDNMVSLVKHFGNLNITETKATDVSYFNVIGNWFVHYNASFNLVVVVLVNLLFIVLLVWIFKSKKIRTGGFIIGTLLFPVVLIIIYFASNYLLKFTLSLYPMYSHFDENNSYNCAWYFLAMSAMAVTIFSFSYYLASKKMRADSLLSGILFIVVMLMNGMQYAIPSASYLLFIPLLFIIAFRLFVLSRKANEGKSDLQINFLNLASVLPAICLVAPILYFTFIAFALGSTMPFVVVGVGICAGLLFPVFYACLKANGYLIPVIAVGCFLGAMLGGHFTSGYSQKYPLPSSIRYILDADSSKAKWVSDFVATDKWSAGFFNGGINHSGVSRYRGMLTGAAPVLSILPPSVSIVKDTLENGIRKLTLLFNSARQNASFLNISIADSNKVKIDSINKQQVDTAQNGDASFFRTLVFTGVPLNGVEVAFEMGIDKKLNIIVYDRSIGLPSIPGVNTTYPEDIIPAQNSNSNTLQVRKHYVF